jgi:putative phage-type endonuclease
MNMIDRIDWLAQRRTGIGGSDAAAILGLSKWNTPLTLWLDKTGQAVESGENEQEKRWGTILEPVIKQEYAQRTGRAIFAPGMQRHIKHHFMIANVDGVSNDDRLVEIKTARTSEGWGEEGSDQVPEDYLIQVQHYLTVLELGVADVAVLIGGSDFRIYTIQADVELQAMLIDAEARFWQLVVDRVAPAPTSFSDAQALYRSVRSKSVVASEAVLNAVDRLRVVKQVLKNYADEEDKCKAEIAAYMGENDTLIDGAGKVLATWKLAAAPKRLDAKALAAKHPDIHAAFLKEGEASRRFLLKEGK